MLVYQLIQYSHTPCCILNRQQVHDDIVTYSYVFPLFNYQSSRDT
nr:MAG TPA: hypothetical protein [Caudoviricetes sp.]